MVEQSIPKKEALSIIKEIEASSRITQRQLSDKLGISLGKTNYLLKELTQKGLIKLKRFKNSKNKIAYLYILTPKGLKHKSELARDFLKRKLQEYECLKNEIEELKNETTINA